MNRPTVRDVVSTIIIRGNRFSLPSCCSWTINQRGVVKLISTSQTNTLATFITDNVIGFNHFFLVL